MNRTPKLMNRNCPFDGLIPETTKKEHTYKEYARCSRQECPARNWVLLEDWNKRVRKSQPKLPGNEKLIQHTKPGWDWEYEDADCTKPTVLAGMDNDVLLLTDDNDGNPCLDSTPDDLMLLECAYAVPHRCLDNNCPGNIIWQQLGLYAEMAQYLIDYGQRIDAGYLTTEGMTTSRATDLGKRAAALAGVEKESR